MNEHSVSHNYYSAYPDEPCALTLVCMKAFLRYKWKADHVENGMLWFFAYISRMPEKVLKRGVT